MPRRASSEIVLDAQTEVPVVAATTERQRALRRIAELYVSIDPRPLVDNDPILVVALSTPSRGGGGVGCAVIYPKRPGRARVEILRATVDFQSTSLLMIVSRLGTATLYT